jgi:hypothetical protein
MSKGLAARDRSINLRDTEAIDYGVADEDDDEENELNELRRENQLATVWNDGGVTKDEALWKLEKMFSSLVDKHEDAETNETIYETLLTAHRSVSRITE